MQRNYLFEATITDEESGELIAKITGLSQDDFEQEMGKHKWSEAIKRYEDKLEMEAQALLDEQKENEI